MKSVRIIILNDVKCVNLVKKLSDYCLDHNKTCEDCKWYLEYAGVRKKHFIFECERSEKKTAKLPKYYISKFPDLFNFCGK